MNPNNTIPVFKPSYDLKEVHEIKKVLLSGWIGLGPKTAEFEKKFAEYVGAKYSIALNSATAALHLSLIAADIKSGDEVILPSLTFVSTAHVILYLGAKPIFADIHHDSLCISPEDCATKITSKTKAIIPVHYVGYPCDLNKFSLLAKKYNLIIIEDASHACGSMFQGKKIGSISPLTCFSFHAVKNLATGDGGMITTNDKKLADKLYKLRWMGINKSTWTRIAEISDSSNKRGYGWYYEVDELGYKYHMNDITAALGVIQLKKLDKANKKRRILAERYTQKLKYIPGIECPVYNSNIVSAQHNYVIKTEQRDELYLHLLDNNISSGVHYYPLHLQPFYRKMYPKLQLTNTESVWKKLLTLPLYPDLTFKQQDYVIETITSFFNRLQKNKFISNQTISGKRITLTPISEKYLERVRQWRNGNRESFLDSSIISSKQQKSWFNQIYQNNPNDIIFMIKTKSGQTIGTISLYNYDSKKQTAKYGRMLLGNKHFRGKGYAKEATNVLLNYAFNKTNIKKIHLEVIKDNLNAINLYKKVGFLIGKKYIKNGHKLVLMEIGQKELSQKFD